MSTYSAPESLPLRPLNPAAADPSIEQLQDRLRANQQLLERYAGTSLAPTLRQDGRHLQQQLDALLAPQGQAA